MPLKSFIDETIQELGTDANEVLVERVDFLRNGAGPNDNDATVRLNDMFTGH
jgi:limonene-1,2-epoxide hydrolase